MKRRFQIQVLPDLAWAELIRRFCHIDTLGFDVATTSDQFVDWKNPSTPWFDLWGVLSAAAQATERVRLAPCVAQIPMRDPATFARQVATVDHISKGRVEVALGLGLTVDPGYAMIGVPNWSNRERFDRFREYLAIVSELLSGSITDYAGEYYVVDKAKVHDPVQTPRPPITVAAMGPKMMTLTARHADTWNAMSFRSGFDDLMEDATHLKTEMTRACEIAGRDPQTLRHSFLLFDASARESGGRMFYWESAQQFADCAGALLALGYDEIGAYYPVDSQRDVLERVAADVIPDLR